MRSRERNGRLVGEPVRNYRSYCEPYRANLADLVLPIAGIIG